MQFIIANAQKAFCFYRGEPFERPLLAESGHSKELSSFECQNQHPPSDHRDAAPFA
jgi:hypothetical protein